MNCDHSVAHCVKDSSRSHLFPRTRSERNPWYCCYQICPSLCCCCDFARNFST